MVSGVYVGELLFWTLSTLVEGVSIVSATFFLLLYRKNPKTIFGNNYFFSLNMACAICNIIGFLVAAIVCAHSLKHLGYHLTLPFQALMLFSELCTVQVPAVLVPLVVCFVTGQLSRQVVLALQASLAAAALCVTALCVAAAQAAASGSVHNSLLRFLLSLSARAPVVLVACVAPVAAAAALCATMALLLRRREREFGRGSSIPLALSESRAHGAVQDARLSEEELTEQTRERVYSKRVRIATARAAFVLAGFCMYCVGFAIYYYLKDLEVELYVLINVSLIMVGSTLLVMAPALWGPLLRRVCCCAPR